MGASMKTDKFVEGRKYKALVFGDEVVVMSRTECFVRVRGIVEGRYKICYSVSQKPNEATEFFTARNHDKNGIPKTWVFYAEDVVTESARKLPQNNSKPFNTIND